jgi:hypothetical protein
VREPFAAPSTATSLPMLGRRSCGSTSGSISNHWNRRLDPAAVGQLVASIHRVKHYARSPVHWWYTEAVGAVRWDELVRELVAVGDPFAPKLAAQRDELVALEALLEAPSNPCSPATVISSSTTSCERRRAGVA